MSRTFKFEPPKSGQERWRSFLVSPQTILGWHRSLVKRRWTYAHRRPGRPTLAKHTAELICRLGRENPRWGSICIVGELKTLGVCIEEQSRVTDVLGAEAAEPQAPDTGF